MPIKEQESFFDRKKNIFVFVGAIAAVATASAIWFGNFNIDRNANKPVNNVQKSEGDCSPNVSTGNGNVKISC